MSPSTDQFLTAQSPAGRFLLGLQFIYRAAVGRAVLARPSVYVFVVLSVSRPVLPLGQMLSPDDVILSRLQSISQLFFCQVRELTFQTKTWSPGRNVYLVKIGPKSLEMDVRTFPRIKNAICDQLLATKAAIIQS